MHKVIVCDHGFEGSRMEQSGTPREREHKMTPTPSGTLSMKHEVSNLENGFKALEHNLHVYYNFPNRLQVLTESSRATY